MSASSSPQERLRRQTGEARRRHAAVDTEIERRVDRPPEPGDLFVLAETAEHPVEWVILDRDPSDPRRLLAVPADSNSLVGSADVAVADDHPRGPMSLRCAHSVWVDAAAFDHEHRTGFLAPAIVERAVRKCDDVTRGVVAGSVLEREVDGEADYQEWVETLELARRLAPERPAASATPEPDSGEGSGEERSPERAETGTVVPFRGPSRWGSTSTLFAIAASVLLALTVGLGRKHVVDSARTYEAVVAEQRAELARLEQERLRLEDRHGQDRARWHDERQRLEQESQQRISELEAAAQPKAQINLPLLILASSQLRSNTDTVEVAPDAKSLMLILQVDDPNAYPTYRLEIMTRDTGRRIWRDSHLKPGRLSGLSVLLPRSLMPDGQYELRLAGLRDGNPKQLMKRILTVETTSRPGN